MKRGLFIILFIVFILFISGLQSCTVSSPTTISVGTQNTCCILSRTGNPEKYCISDISQRQCDGLFSITTYYSSEVFEIGLANSCADKCDIPSLSCTYQGNIYENGERFCGGNSKIYQCLNGKWVNELSCPTSDGFAGCENTQPCIHPLTRTLCSNGLCCSKGICII